MLIRCRREAKEERSHSSNVRGGRKGRGKSEVRSKSQTKEKRELSSNCGGRKDTDSIAVFTGTIAAVSYTHLTLPTNREV